jgi:hypothetical protein
VTPGTRGTVVTTTWVPNTANVAPVIVRSGLVLKLVGITESPPSWPLNVSRSTVLLVDLALTSVRGGVGVAAAATIAAF